MSESFILVAADPPIQYPSRIRVISESYPSHIRVTSESHPSHISASHPSRRRRCASLARTFRAGVRRPGPPVRMGRIRAVSEPHPQHPSRSIRVSSIRVGGTKAVPSPRTAAARLFRARGDRAASASRPRRIRVASASPRHRVVSESYPSHPSRIRVASGTVPSVPARLSRASPGAGAGLQAAVALSRRR
jgi:hypothetical protein